MYIIKSGSASSYCSVILEYGENTTSMSDKIKVLAVDDAPANLMILKGCLRGGNFELVTCTNAIDALQEFKKQYFDILLLDVIMPGIDGFELRKLIREVDKERPIIFLTAMIDDGNMTMLNQITWDSNTYYLNKVFDKKVLVQKITEVVNMHRTRQLDRVYRDNLESELKLAGDLQRILLPDWCILDDKVLVSSLYVPAMQVSGDIFELIRLDESRYLFFIGDIAGHGISAALYMATVQAILKIKAHEQNFTVHGLLADLNRFFCDELRGNTYMTALAVLFDFKSNHLVLHSAGHPPLLICPAGREPLFTAGEDKGGIPLGWFVNAEYRAEDNFEYDFDDDTMFLGVTDGVFDTAGEDGEFITKNELHDIVEALTADTDATVFPYRLKSMMEQMGYENISDDFTVVALQKRQCRADCIERLIPAKLSEVNKVATEFSSIAEDLRQISEIELCVHEFLNNVIVHGNAGSNQRPDLIYINIAKEKGKFKIRGLEHGKKWDPSNMENIDGRNAEDRSSPATSGRGMQILQAITDHVTYNSYCDLNETCFTLKSGEKNDN